VLVPILLLGLWARFFVLDIVHFTIHDNPSMPLWDAVVMPIFGYSRVAAALLSFALALTTGLTVNRMVSKYSLLQKQSLLPLFIFMLLTAAFLSVQKLNPVLIFAFFFAFAIERLLGSVNESKPVVRCFDASLLVGVGALFFAKGTFLYPILFLVMGILRVANYRTVIASLMGFLFPFAISLAWFFLIDEMGYFLSQINENLFTNLGQYNHTIYSEIYLGVFIFMNAIAIVVLARNMSAQKVIIRKYFRVFIWIVFLTGIGVLLPFFSMEIFPIAIIASTIIFSFWIDKKSTKWMQETYLWLIVLLTVFGQLFLS
jgi:hypothetical protein